MLYLDDHFHIHIKNVFAKVEARVSSVTVLTGKAGRWIGKGAHAEERYRLIGILSGCIANNYMSVTV